MVQQPKHTKGEDVREWSDEQVSRLLAAVLAAKPEGRCAVIDLDQHRGAK